MLHFVGFKGEEFGRAKLVFGPPDFIHRYWDMRAQQEAVQGDVVIFATEKEASLEATPRLHSFNDSEYF